MVCIDWGIGEIAKKISGLFLAKEIFMLHGHRKGVSQGAMAPPLFASYLV